MIKLEKAELPQVLEDNAARWTAELLRHIANATDPSAYLLGRYSHPEIKGAVIAETRNKCAYCESKFRHVTYGDIEHIVPKDSAPELRFAWANLTAACDVCNTNKGNSTGLIDPYGVDPRRVFYHIGALIFAVPNNEPALLTETRLRLNRDALVERRNEKVKHIQALARTIERTEGDVREALIEVLKEEAAPDKAYSSCSATAIEVILDILKEA